MELKINNISPTVCLNMIVKNESHIIKDTLEMLCNKINFSYWVICDTGSSDNTRSIITEFFRSKDIQGELHNHRWTNFAHNRTLALEEAFGKSDLLFIFDADDEIHGDIKIPTQVDSDGYMLYFGSSAGVSYQRVLLVNNNIKWNYQSVIHEYINCLKPNAKITTLEGNYYVVSGRKGSRNSDPEKYIKDATILKEAYYEAKNNNNSLYLRYGFYCANSYKDAGKPENAIEWYKIVLKNDNWFQEKYISCLNLYNEYNKIEEKEKGIYYLIESFKYDIERMECVYHLVHYYCLNNLHNLSYSYYSLIKDFYENKYLDSCIDGKLFIETDKANFYLPYYIILVADKVKEQIPEAKKSIIKAFEIIFIKKYPISDEFYIRNLLHNVQFFIKFYDNQSEFLESFQEYIYFLEENMNIDLSKHEFLKIYEKYGIKFKSFESKKPIFSYEECKNSKNILFYTGFSHVPWNDTYSKNNALGGSETAVVNLAKSFPTDYEIYIGGQVGQEKIDNVTYINLDNIRDLVQKTPFHTVIVSRYIAFYEMFPESSFYQSYIWAHDITLLPYGCDKNIDSILNIWNTKINSCICQTEWHKNLYAELYPQLKDKIITINNGINVDRMIHIPIKVSNRFIYTSCSERGLDRILELWPQIINLFPNAELMIASYIIFPQNAFEIELNVTINKYNNIKHVGSLNKNDLYQLMSTAEFWLYPTNWEETSCITAMEMLMSEVICLYYPVAGLVETLGDYGIQVQRGNEIKALADLSVDKKSEMRKRGKSYAFSCSWENRANVWTNQLKLNLNKKQLWVFYCSKNFNQQTIKDYIYNLNKIYPDYNIYLTSDKEFILSKNPCKVTFIFNLFDQNIIYKLPNCHFSYLNTEPLNIPLRLNMVVDIIKSNNLDYYDYSKSNIQILKENNINTNNFVYLPYACNTDEVTMLTNLNINTYKKYDFGLIIAAGGDITERRKLIVEFLEKNGFSVKIIEGWDLDRDQELAECNIILNIHGFCNKPSEIFEHIRCDRLLASGFNILSETSLYLDNDFIKKYPNLTLIDYDDFFNDDIIKNYVNSQIKVISNYCFIHS